MISFLKDLIKPSSPQESLENKEHRLRLACLALLFETAKSDHQLDEDEIQTIIAFAQTRFQVTESEAEALANHARQNANDSTSLYEFTSLIHEELDEAAKFRLIQAMWEVANADGRIDRYEEHIIRRAAELLYLDHARFIEAKLSVLGH